MWSVLYEVSLLVLAWFLMYSEKWFPYTGVTLFSALQPWCNTSNVVPDSDSDFWSDLWLNDFLIIFCVIFLFYLIINRAVWMRLLRLWRPAGMLSFVLWRGVQQGCVGRRGCAKGWTLEGRWGKEPEQGGGEWDESETWWSRRAAWACPGNGYAFGEDVGCRGSYRYLKNNTWRAEGLIS